MIRRHYMLGAPETLPGERLTVALGVIGAVVLDRTGRALSPDDVLRVRGDFAPGVSRDRMLLFPSIPGGRHSGHRLALRVNDPAGQPEEYYQEVPRGRYRQFDAYRASFYPPDHDPSKLVVPTERSLGHMAAGVEFVAMAMQDYPELCSLNLRLLERPAEVEVANSAC